jgi:septum site-determining protein MinC
MTARTESGADGAQPVLEIKAASFSLPVIRLLRVEMDDVAEQIKSKVEQAPDFFLHAPVVIDLGGLDDPDDEINFPRLVGLLRGFGMLPVGLRGGSATQQEAARAMELVLMSDGARRRVRETRNENESMNEETASSDPDSRGADASEHNDTTDAGIGVEIGSTLISRPVRSGQKVYAAGGDLTVMAAVNSGAELMADGNIHIYGPMRGRVFAGIKGNTSARIFCQDLQAELVAVAGHYRVSENIPPNLKNARVQIYLDHETLRIEPF